MKEIKAIVRPTRLHKIRDAFRHLSGFPGMSISHVEGCSAHVGAEQHDTLKEELTDFTKKVRIEIVAPDEMVPDILRIIHHNAHTGQTGDGVLWVTEVGEFLRLCQAEG
ncbi:P-II family nitrogen regulator [Sulfuricella sp.]|uniref:P-II family nitrogen regulator n=1 Tax=Sulfuricella sp. TaxID=2099377 RepID=UPI002B9F488F|nr:P-II family nitrogen regulator [Sulfuricella sp.]HUX64995.1 P-II family nitrogen regulator [Sulfuricella sp.]